MANFSAFCVIFNQDRHKFSKQDESGKVYSIHKEYIYINAFVINLWIVQAVNKITEQNFFDH